MAISDKITSIQDHLKDDWDSVESLIGDTELDKNIENISSALDDLYNDLPKVTGSGTSITLDDTKKGRLESTLSGNTSQTQYTGKNLLPPTIATETKNGITLTNNGDGSYTLTGTYSTSTTFDMALPATLNGTYSFSGNNPTAGKNIQFRISASSGSSLSTYLNKVNSISENKTIENGTKQSIRIVGSFTSGFTFKPQLESGSTATSYEPYVGGVAVPNPTSPIDVDVVSGDNEINVCGKNKLSPTLNDINEIISGVKREGSNGIYTLSGTATTGGGGNDKYTLTNTYTIQNGDYLHLCNSTTNTNSTIMIFNENNTQINNWAFNSINRVINISSYAGQKIKSIGFYNNSSFSGSLTTSPMIINSNTVTNFEPYQGNTYNIDLPVENLFDKDNVINAYLNADGTTTLNSSFRVSDYIDVSGCQNITISGNYGGSELCCFYDESKNFISNFGMGTMQSRSASVPSNAKYLRATIHNTVLDKYQIEVGTKANSFTPYGTTPIELCKIGNYQDYFGKSDGRNLFDKSLFGAFTTTIQYVDITLKPNTTYTMSSNIPITSGVGANLFFMKDGETASTSTNGVRPDTPVTLTTDSTGNVRVGYRNAGGITNPIENYWYMINEGSSALPCQPFGVGKWYLHKEIGKVVFNGSENTAREDTSTSGNYRFDVLSSVAFKYGDTSYIAEMLCNKLLPTSRNGTYLSQQGITVFYSSGYPYCQVYIEETKTLSIADFKTWLSNNNLTVYGVLQTPTNTEITDTTLINQLEELYIAKSKENQTNISQINNDLPFIISASALKKGDTIENNSASLLMSVEESPNTNVEEETPDFEEDVSDVEEETPIEESIEEEIDEEPVEEETEIEEGE